MIDLYENGFFQSFMDLKNFFKFKKQISGELNEPKSGMNTFNIKRNWLGNILYTQINCTDADLMNADYNFDRMVMTKLKPIVKYLGQDLGWSDYLVPQVSNFVDENDNPTLSYGVLFVFTGYNLTLTKIFWTLVVLLGLSITGIISLCHFL